MPSAGVLSGRRATVCRGGEALNQKAYFLIYFALAACGGEEMRGEFGGGSVAQEFVDDIGVSPRGGDDEGGDARAVAGVRRGVVVVQQGDGAFA